MLSGVVVIKWDASDNCDDNLLINIEYSNDAGLTWHVIATDEKNDGKYEWNTFVLPDGTDYMIRISTSDDAGNKNHDVSNGAFTISNPATPLSLSIVKPRGHLYIMDREVTPLPGNTTIVVGAITIEVDIESIAAIEKVEFYIDGELKAILTDEPYHWLWDEKSFFTHTIKVVAHDIAENTAMDEQTLLIFNP